MSRLLTSVAALTASTVLGCGTIAVAPQNPAAACKAEGCDDQLSCTTDACDSNGNCTHTLKSGSCVIDDKCYSAGDDSKVNACKVCTPAKSSDAWSNLECSTDEPCRVSTCDANQGCVVTDDDALPCDDGDSCTTDDHCQGGQCVASPCACQTAQDCTELRDKVACQRWECTDNECKSKPDAGQNGDACDDGDACSDGDACDAGVCIPGAAKDCFSAGDGVCSTGVCDEATGDCVTEEASAGTGCDDGDACTSADHCDGGECVGLALDCPDDGNQCVSNDCVEGTCQKTVHTGDPCALDNACILSPACNSTGDCTGTWDMTCSCTTNLDCPGGTACSNSLCDIGTGACVAQVFPGSCLIDGECYLSNDTDPDNPCQVCQPDGTATEWSEVACEDGNPCTLNACDPAQGCTIDSTALDGGGCDDGQSCTKDDHCEAGQCVGTCDCTSDAQCDGKVEIADCQMARCIGFECVAAPDPGQAGGACDDSDACTTGEACDGEGSCTGGSPIECPDGGPCAVGVCNPATGQCAVELVADGTECSDGDQCTTGDSCAQGLCAGAGVDCSSFVDQCHSATCALGKCEQAVLTNTPCDDNDACTVGDGCSPDGQCLGDHDGGNPACLCAGDDANCADGLSCTTGVCKPDGSCSFLIKPGFCKVGGACYAAGANGPNNACLVCDPATSKTSFKSVTCDDSNSCTDDICAPAQGCTATNNDLNACSDGDPCTQDDHCDAGACVGSCACKSDAQCELTQPAADSCRRWACQGYQCIQVADSAQDGSSCDDGKFCTVDETCQGGSCQGGAPKDCSGLGDGKCVVGACDEGVDQCAQQPKADGDSCSDGDPCTQGDACADGTCAGSAIDCSDLEGPCHIAACVAGACKKTATPGAACDDQEACTELDVCGTAGGCAGTWDAGLSGCGCDDDADCADVGDACNLGRCDIDTHQCYKEPALGDPCDDTNPCTFGDACNADGQCAGSGYGCNDDLDCTVDSCDGEGGCTHDQKGDTCLIGGACFNEGQIDPENPCHRCDGGEEWAANPGADCDDEDPCTDQDSCDGTGACGGLAFTCESSLCQVASCNGSGCDSKLLPGFCLIDGACVAGGAIEPGNACRACLPAASTTDWSNTSNQCDDSDPCTKGDLCSAGVCKGTGFTCADTVCEVIACDGIGGCFSEGLKPDWCKIGGSCIPGGAINEANPCQECNPGTSAPTQWSPRVGQLCNDGLPCTVGDVCNEEGVCEGSGANCEPTLCENAACADGGCLYKLKPGWCKIDGQCVAEGELNAGNPCEICIAETTDAWSVFDGQCDDDIPCTYGDACSPGKGGAVCAGTEYTCDDGIECTLDACGGSGPKDCSSSLPAGACVIDDVCWAAGTVNPTNECQYCDPDVSAGFWTNLGADAECADDGLLCTRDFCDGGGSCVHKVDDSVDACLIGNTCWEVGAVNPKNSCQVCQSQGDTSWAAMAVGTACEDDGEACTTDSCSNFGVCTHSSLPNYSVCDDASGATYGDWCYWGVCGGFSLALGGAAVSPWEAGDPDPDNDSDRLILGEVQDSKLLHLVYSAVSGVKTSHWMYAGIPPETATLTTELGGALVAALGDRVLVTSKGALYEYAGSWTSDTELAAAWQEAGIGDTYRAVTGEGGTVFGAGWSTEGQQAFVRECGGIFGVECVDWPVEDGESYELRAIAWIENVGHVIAGDYVAGKAQDVLVLQGDSWAKITRWVPTDGSKGQWTDLAVVNKQLVGTLSSGHILVGDQSVLSEVPPLFTSMGLTSFRQVARYDGRVFVLGDYTDKAGTRVFVLVHASEEELQATAEVWQVVTLASVVEQGAGGGDYVLSGIAGTVNALQVFGSWTGKFQSRTPAIFTWAP